MRALWNSGGLPWWFARPFYLLLLKGFPLAVAALAAAVWWAVVEGPNISGLSDLDISSAQLIRERNSFFLVPTEWISGSANAGRVSDVEWRWLIAETKARLAVVFILWAVGVSFFIWHYSRRRAQALPANPPGTVGRAG